MHTLLQTSTVFLSIGLVLTSTSCKDSGQAPSNASDLPNAPIPRFPEQGLPDSTAATTAELGPTFPQKESSGTTTLDTQTGLTTTTTTTTSTTSTSSPVQSSAPGPETTSAPKPDPSSDPGPSPDTGPEPAPPKQAPFVDWGGFRVARFDDGEIYESAKVKTPNNEHQVTRLGYERVVSDVLGTGAIIRRTYAIFDVSQVRGAVAAKIEFFTFASSRASNSYGGYSSPDPSETVELHSLDRFTPQQLLDAPFEQKQNHTLDPKISEDLADGDLYARFEISPEFLAEDKLRPAPTATPKRSDCSNTQERACGRWLTIPLTAKAVQDINQSSSQWGMGWNLTSIDHANSDSPTREFLFFGAHMDTSPNHKALLPDYVKPKPRLVLEY